VAGDEETRALVQAGYRYALSLRFAPADAEDLVQEAWFRLLRRYGKVANRALLFTAIRNLFYERHRRERLLIFDGLEADSALEADGSAAAPDAPPEALAAALAGLRTEEREALYLIVVEGYSTAEAAALLDRPQGTVSSLVHRAKAKLRRTLLAQNDRDEGDVGDTG